MKVLLVYPEYPDTFWSFQHALSYNFKKATLPPLGLLTVAAMLPSDWDLRLIDMNVRRLKTSDIKWSDMVFVSAMIVQKDSAQTVMSRAKTLGKRVVAGGPFFTSCEDKEYSRNADHLILNEAEVTLPPFLQDLETGNLKFSYTSAAKPELTQTPLPRWSLINLRDYAMMSVQYTRGCPFNCEFCDITKLFGRITRPKGEPQFITEMQALYDAGWRGNVFIVDDNFVGNIKRVKEMLPHLISWQEEHDYPFSFLTEASVNLAKDKNLMRLMQKASFSRVFLGIETPSRESLKECKKGQNVHVDLVEVVKTIQSYGMEVMGGFIVGFDSDTPKIFQDQIEFIQKTGITTAMVGLLGALPKTDLWKRLKESGRLLGEYTGDNLSTRINFVPVMNREVLIDGYKHVLSEIYSVRKYYQRIDVLLKNIGPARSSKLKGSDCIAFLQSIVRIGVFSKARFFYWKLVFSNCFNRNTFYLAIQSAILGEHFRRVADEVAR